MKTQAETDRIKLGAKIRYRDALVRFQTKHLDFRLLAAEELHGNNSEHGGGISTETTPATPQEEVDVTPDSNIAEGRGAQDDLTATY